MRNCLFTHPIGGGSQPPVPAPAMPASPLAGPDASVLVLTAHPQLAQSRVNRRLMEAALACGSPVEVRDLYRLYPDYVIDVAAEQACLQRARLIVWQHPIHWYHMPALMKLWVDEVLSYGWAYGPEGTALHGKDLWLVASTGGPEDSYHPDNYNRYFFEAFLPPYEQTAALCGMRFVPPLILHGAHRVSPDELNAHASLYAQRLQSHPHWAALPTATDCLGGDVPASARPAASPP